MKPINLQSKLELIHETWSPRIVAELNGQHVKLAKLTGDFVWHKHDDADELFYVIRGHLSMDFRDRRVEVGEGELIVVPRGVEHKPFAEDEAHVMLFEPAGTVNTGDAGGERTVADPERI